MVPTNGNSEAAVAHPTSMGSSMRRRASAYVQKTSAAQMTMRTRIRTLIAVFTASLLIPKMPRTSMVVAWKPSRRGGRNASQERATECVPDREEDQDDECDHDRHERDHRQDARAAVVHRALALRLPRGLSRSA